MIRHFIDINDYTKIELLALLQQSQSFIAQGLTCARASLAGKTVCNLFFEPSTRTLASFTLAAQKLNAQVLNLPIEHSSTVKGETLIDTVLNLQAMGVDTFVVRHREAVMQEISAVLNPGVRLVSAGEGCLHHPSQAVLDMLTIQQMKKNFESLKIALVGDIKHSRVAHSDIAALKLLGCNDIRLIGPENLLPDNVVGVEYDTNLASGLKNVDVIIMLRIQRERMASGLIRSEQEYIEQYQLNAKTLQYAASDAIVMHPGPVNRDVEMTSEMVDGPRSMILKQVHNGVAARMAILSGK